MNTCDGIAKKEGESVQTERTRGGATYVPAVDILETPTELFLYADMPGVRADEIDIQYDRGELTISGRAWPRQSPETAYLLREYGVGDFARSFRVGEGIDSAKISAEMKNGTLMLRLPKSEAARSRKIAVKPSM